MHLIPVSGKRSSVYRSALGVQFEYQTSTGTAVGHGLTAELSQHTVLLQSDDPPPVGATVELRVDWPFLLQGVCPLEVRMTGEVASVSEKGTVVETYTYEFRTRGERSFSESLYNPNTCLVA
jgi:hypothetical protein